MSEKQPAHLVLLEKLETLYKSLTNVYEEMEREAHENCPTGNITGGGTCSPEMVRGELDSIMAMNIRTKCELILEILQTVTIPTEARAMVAERLEKMNPELIWTYPYEQPCRDRWNTLIAELRAGNSE